ncbi:ABC transporter permease [Rhodococcus erythropolis]|uniref:ABC transporter permease n=1 Tax=Rhodococcus qingshengii TaxID=334542 RepID=UPI0005A5E85F|nr:ABC transporter permease [Rhodococcus qingshengii]MCZ4547259.1 ABC transporter permease [Rhodococcus qingshengii]MDJ0489944.1 ABC transporter permease [Rhodococcus qingshengii]OKA12563.1 ABC transporter permease [Rhodococcus erythropolis]REK78134.1 ABC transporter permease [Rhodococcus erythropolis]
MLKLVTSRILASVPLLLLVAFLSFVLLELANRGTDPAARIAGDGASPEQIETIRQNLNLDSPMIVRYAEWVGHAVTGDLGKSLYSGQAVTDAIMERIWITGSLALWAIILTIVIGIPLGVWAAVRQGSLVDRAVTTVAALLMSVPPFVLGLLLVITFAITRAWLPATGYVTIAEGGIVEWSRHLILPALALAAVSAAELARQTRGSIVDALNKDYVRTSRAKGLSGRSVLWKHTMKNAAVSIVTVLGMQMGRILGGAVTVEFVFAISGLGMLGYTAVVQRDLPMVQGVVIISALVVLICNLLVDMSYGYLNPKIRK